MNGEYMKMKFNLTLASILVSASFSVMAQDTNSGLPQLQSGASQPEMIVKTIGQAQTVTSTVPTESSVQPPVPTPLTTTVINSPSNVGVTSSATNTVPSSSLSINSEDNVVPPENVAEAPPLLPRGEGIEVGVGNAFENTTTPLLREISRRKAILELTKLDAEKRKIELDIIKTQQEIINAKENKDKPKVSTNGDPQILSREVMPVPSAVPQIIPVQSFAEPETPISVSMIYGYEDKLFARINVGSQGGFVVSRGDILPDGKKVSRITSDYLVVVDKDGKQKRIYPSASSSSVGLGGGLGSLPGPQNVQGNGNMSSQNVPVSNLPLPTSMPMRSGNPGIMAR